VLQHFGDLVLGIRTCAGEIECSGSSIVCAPLLASHPVGVCPSADAKLRGSPAASA
jgi:hypothetical protein